MFYLFISGNIYVGILRLGQWLSGNAPTTWKDSMNQALMHSCFYQSPQYIETPHLLWLRKSKSKLHLTKPKKKFWILFMNLKPVH